MLTRVFRKYYVVDEFIRVCINHCYINIHRIQTDAESLFNAIKLQPIKAKAQEYCTCKKKATSFPFGEPDFACNLTTAMQPCREQTIPSSVFNGRCKSVTHERRKRAIEVVDDEEPEQIQLPLNDPDDIEVHVYLLIVFYVERN
jgi:hypothetical protein